MMKLEFALPKDRPLRILCLGAHSDDIEIGCGGTILKLIQEHKSTAFYWVVFSANQERKKEAIKSASVLLKNAKERTVVIKEFRDGFFPFIGGKIKEYFETLKHAFSPDLIFAHHRNDLHQDHRLVSELTWNTFRDHLILEYEIPKYDGDLGAPNVFVHLGEGIVRQKVQHVLKSFKSQNENHWFTEETFRSMYRLRGVEAKSPTGYSEAFYNRKLSLGWAGK
jgi:LmbE family N-acetylglucosaminyl deacetylase